MRHRASRLTRQPHTPGHRLTGVTAVLSLIAASGVAVVIGTSFASSPTNLISNSGFESDLSGWTKLNSPVHLDRSDDAHDGSHAAQLSADSVNTVVLKDQPNTVTDTASGSVYHVSVWVKAPTPSVDAVLRLRETKSGRLVGQHSEQLRLKDNAWHQIQFDYTTKGAGNALDYNVMARNLAVGHVLMVDDTWLSTSDSTPTAPTPTPTPTPTTPTPPVATPPPPPPVTPPVVVPPVVTPVGGDTLFGTSIYQEPGETFAQAYQRRVATYGQMAIDRVFYPGLPAAWPGNAGYSGGPVVVSFKASPQTVLTGAYDASLKNWFATAPRGRQVWWTYFHEPEDNIEAGEFTAAQYRAAWQRIAGLADTASNSDLHATLILMCFSLEKSSGRSFADYYPGSAYIDTLGFDCYNQMAGKGGYIDPAKQFASVLSVAAAEGKPWGLAEFGSQLVAGDSGAGRAAWLVASAAWLSAHQASWVTYFDSPVSNEYRLMDSASKAAWRTVVTSM